MKSFITLKKEDVEKIEDLQVSLQNLNESIPYNHYTDIVCAWCVRTKQHFVGAANGLKNNDGTNVYTVMQIANAIDELAQAYALTDNIRFAHGEDWPYSDGVSVLEHRIRHCKAILHVSLQQTILSE